MKNKKSWFKHKISNTDKVNCKILLNILKRYPLSEYKKEAMGNVENDIYFPNNNLDSDGKENKSSSGDSRD